MGLPHGYSDPLSCIPYCREHAPLFQNSFSVPFVLFLVPILLGDISWGNLNKCYLRQKCLLQIENQRPSHQSLIGKPMDSSWLFTGLFEWDYMQERGWQRQSCRQKTQPRISDDSWKLHSWSSLKNQLSLLVRESLLLTDKLLLLI